MSSRSKKKKQIEQLGDKAAFWMMLQLQGPSRHGCLPDTGSDTIMHAVTDKPCQAALGSDICA